MHTEDILKDKLTCKTYINCNKNNIPYDEAHRRMIEKVDNFMNKPETINLITSCGISSKSNYYFNKKRNRWYYIMHFAGNRTKGKTTAIISSSTITIKMED